MKRSSLSIRSSLGIVITLMGLVALLLALATGEIYHQLALENQRASLTHLVQSESREVLEHLADASRELGMAVQASPAFKEAFYKRDDQALTQALDARFDPLFVVTDVPILVKIALYDTQFRLIAESSQVSGEGGKVGRICAPVAVRAQPREEARQAGMLSDLCLYKGNPYYKVVVPVGGLRVEGYLVVITHPIHALMLIGRELGMPIRLSVPGADTEYDSESWPPGRVDTDKLLAQYTLNNRFGEPMLSIGVLDDIHLLNAKLTETRYLVASMAGMVTTLAILIAFVVFEKTTFSPLKALSQSVRRVREDRAQLSRPVRPRGNREICQLALDFNAMAGELNELYSALEHMAFTDSLTELPNRSKFNDRLDQGLKLCERLGTGLALCMMDLNRFKEINDSLGHAVGDKLLREVGLRFKGILRKSDTVGLLSEGMIARLGGDEFAAILPTVRNESDASVVAMKIKSAIDPPIVVNGHALSVSVSIGIALFPKHGENLEALMRHADAAMYRAKRKGLDFVIFEPGNDGEGLL